jgi:hypothetical protein
MSLAACASTPDFDYGSRGPAQGSVADATTPLQCVPYARVHSGIQIYGDAYTWWDKSDGQYAHSQTPLLGSVMMLTGYAGPNHAHLAVVRSVVSAREIKVDHANWLNDGAIYIDDPVMDVSDDNDWSAVKVWNIRAQAWGSKVYPVQGFIGPGKGGDQDHGGSDDLVSIN